MLIVPAIQNENSSYHPRNSHHFKHSGRNSRRRRQVKRQQARKDETSSSLSSVDCGVQLGLASDQQQCSHEIEQVSSAIPSNPCLVSTAVQASCPSLNVACETDPFPKEPVLSIMNNAPISIPPREVYHPAIINACKAICDKHPSQLTTEEAHKFNFYLERKCEMGQPVESDLVYLPSSMRNCLHCGYLT